MALTVSVSDGENGTRCISFHGAPTVGTNVLLAAQGAALFARAYSFSVCGAGEDNVVYFTTGSTARFGGSGAAMTLNADGPAGGIVKNHNPEGWFSGSANQALNIEASTTEPIFGTINVKVLSVRV